MRKTLSGDQPFEFVVNAYYIRAYAWNMADPANINTAKLVVQYDLANVDKDGKLTISPYPEHNGITVQLYNVGETTTLTDFLNASGQGKSDDLWEFNYHDLQRLVEKDIKERFDLKV